MKTFKTVGFLLSAITGLSMVLVVSLVALVTKDAFDKREVALHHLSDIRSVQLLVQANTLLRLAQGRVSTALQDPGQISPPELREIIRSRDSGFAALNDVLANYAAHDELKDYVAPLRAAGMAYDTSFTAGLRALRGDSQQSRKTLYADALHRAVFLLDLLSKQAAILGMETESTDSFMSEMAKITRIARKMREDAGVSRHDMVDIITGNAAPTREQVAKVAFSDGRIDGPWAAITDDIDLPFMPEGIKASLRRAQTIYFHNYRAERNKIIGRMERGEGAGVSLQQWLNQFDYALSSLIGIADTALDLSRIHTEKQLSAANHKLYEAMALVTMSFLLAGLTMAVVVFRIVRPLRRIALSMNAVGEGDLEDETPFNHRQDEIGEFARALKTFREQALERRKMEDELLQSRIAQESAEASNRVKSEFLANMSHELRTPLNAVIGFSDVMRQKVYGPLNAQYEDYVRMIHESGQLLLNLVSDILDIAKIESGKFTLDLQKVDLPEVIAACLRLVKKRAHDRRINLQTILPEGTIDLVADPRALKQILLNLLSNAVKFSKAGGRVTLGVAATEEKLRIVVRDDGIGIPADALARIGQAFEQASNDPTRAREGTGLGLALVRSLAMQHGGSIAIQSVQHVGTEVTVELPLSQKTRQAA